MYKNYFLTFLLIVTFNGCTTPVDPKISMKPPVYVDTITAKKVKIIRNEGSLFGRGKNPLFEDKKAMKQNDIVTVEIDENTIQLSSATNKLSDSSTSSLGGGVFTGKLPSKLNHLTDMGLTTNSKSSFNGSGTKSANEKFTTTISARIVRVLENGNYFISGSRELLLSGNKQIIKITGVIRPYDIDQFNTINSKYIADARILYESEGEIEQSVSQPWGTRIVKSVWPF
ncbi:MAG TPA: flagellar basal body L-ring protein FlgH [Campylobacterales bacterium]|nr:flagellar basal body L-ring protein FlgH [Campylobacterales bacterium]